MSDFPKPMDFTLGVRSSQGGMLTTSETINPAEKLSIDLASLVTKLGGDPAGAFSEGSVAVYYIGTIMPIVGQISIRNPQLSLEHESEMVENDPGRSDVPPVLNGVWWGLGGGRQAQVMVTNIGGDPAVAEVHVDFQGKQHALATPLTFAPGETKVLDIAQLLASLGVNPAGVPEGGITIAQAGAHPSLIANGKITDPATGFSSTMDFPLPELERASALHATGLPIGTPRKGSPFAGTGTFAPHVVVRNLVGSPQYVTVTVEYPVAPAASPAVASPGQGNGQPATQPGAGARHIIPRPPMPGDKDHHPEWGAGTGSTTGTLDLGSVVVGPYTTEDFSLASAMDQLPLLPFCSIRIQYSGASGSLEAQVSSVEENTNMVVDARVENEGNGWAGSGANPWHLDSQTESILFLTNESGKMARIGFSVTAGGTHYYLTTLALAPHETRAIDIRALRDAQLADAKGNKIPAAAADGSVTWIRLDNVPVMGRLMVIERHKGFAASYDCCTSCCPASYFGLETQPATFTLIPNTSQQVTPIGFYQDCNYNQTFHSVPAQWYSSNTSVATVSGGDVTGVSGGIADITATYDDSDFDCQSCPYCNPSTYTYGAGSQVTVQVPTSLRLVTTTSQGLAGCGSGSAGWDRRIVWEVLDQSGQPVNQSMSVSDSIAIGSPNTCGASPVTGMGTTDGSGHFPDHYYLCSTGCVGGSCQTAATQTYTVAGITLTGTISIVYTCTGITLNGQ